MATLAQITANQLNASLSTGPKTQEGKAAAARNATKHGLSGAFTVLPHEDQDEFDTLLACLRDEFKPTGDSPAPAASRTQCSTRCSRATFPADDDQRIAAKLLNGGGRALATVQRYAG